MLFIDSLNSYKQGSKAVSSCSVWCVISWSIERGSTLVAFFFYLLCLFHFYKNTKIQNTFTKIILHEKFIKLKDEKLYI